MSGLDDMKARFAEKSGLSDDQFDFYPTEYCNGEYLRLVAEKEDKLVKLGEMYDVRRVAGDNNCFDAFNAVSEVFLDLCAEKLKDNSVKVPNLVGNKKYWADCYKNAM